MNVFTFSCVMSPNVCSDSSESPWGAQRREEIWSTSTSKKAQSQNKIAGASDWKQSTVAASRWHAQSFCGKWGNRAFSRTVIFNNLIYFALFDGYHCFPGSPQGKMIMQDKLEKERNDAKNNVEEYVYDMRDKLHGMLEKYVSESVSKQSPLIRRERIATSSSDCRQIQLVFSKLDLRGCE